jgi:carbon monoxide dehydrogenase subunit G
LLTSLLQRLIKKEHEMHVMVEMKIDASSDTIFDVLLDKGVVENLLPSGTKLTETGPGKFDFLLQKQTSLISLKLPGTLSVEVARPEKTCTFLVKAKHFLAGSLDLQAVMSCKSSSAPNVLTCNATLASKGVIKQLMNNEEERAERILRNVLNGVKSRAEAATRMAAAKAKTKPV